jgi:hypothetical protein
MCCRLGCFSGGPMSEFPYREGDRDIRVRWLSRHPTQAARRMIPKGSGAILLTGATASIERFARSAGFAMGKFAFRGLAHSVARSSGRSGSTSPISSSTARYALLAVSIRPTAQRARSIGTRLPRPASTCGASLGAPGPWRSSYALGSSAAEHVPLPSMKNGRV